MLEIIKNSTLTNNKKETNVTKNRTFNGKILFLWLTNTGVEPNFFKICRHKLQKSLKSCWPGEMLEAERNEKLN